MARDGHARVNVEWMADKGAPADADRWQRVIDSAYAGGYGRVRLVRQADGKWKVTSATTMMPTPAPPGELDTRRPGSTRLITRTRSSVQ